MSDKASIKQTKQTAGKREEPQNISQLASGINDPEMEKWPLKQKQLAMPPVGAIVTAGPIPTPNGWALMPFRITYTNAAKLRISAELINKLIAVPDPPAPAPLSEEEGGRTTLAVHDGVLGATSKL